MTQIGIIKSREEKGQVRPCEDSAILISSFADGRRMGTQSNKWRYDLILGKIQQNGCFSSTFKDNAIN